MPIYTPAAAVIPYIGDYPSMIEFEKPWECAVQVGQGFGSISSDGKPLQSEGFSECSALILKNRSTLETALFHIDDFDFGDRQVGIVEKFINCYLTGLQIEPEQKSMLLSAASDISHYRYPKTMRREEFQARMLDLNSEDDINAQYIVGTDGRNIISRLSDSMLNYLGIPVEEILVDTGRFHWAIVHKPLERKTYVQSKSQQKVMVFNF